MEILYATSCLLYRAFFFGTFHYVCEQLQALRRMLPAYKRVEKFLICHPKYNIAKLNQLREQYQNVRLGETELDKPIHW